MHSGAVRVDVLIQPFQHPDLVLIMEENCNDTANRLGSASVWRSSVHPDVNEVQNSEEPLDEAFLRVSVVRLSYFSMWTPSGVVGWL